MNNKDDEKVVTQQQLSEFKLAVQDSYKSIMVHEEFLKLGFREMALPHLNKAVRNVREANKMLNEMGCVLELND